MARDIKYPGIHNDIQGGMTSTGKIIRDAWLFDLLDENETCEGWNFQGINALQEKVNNEWDKYGCLVSQLPPELFEKHQRIFKKALQQAKEAGWSGEDEMKEE